MTKEIKSKELEAKKKKRNSILIGVGIVVFFVASIGYNIYSINNPAEIDYPSNLTESIDLENVEGTSVSEELKLEAEVENTNEEIEKAFDDATE